MNLDVSTLPPLSQKILQIAIEKGSTIWLQLDPQGQPRPILDRNRKVKISDTVLDEQGLEEALFALMHDRLIETDGIETTIGRAYMLTEAGLKAGATLLKDEK